jgi:hypothetical protein
MGSPFCLGGDERNAGGTRASRRADAEVIHNSDSIDWISIFVQCAEINGRQMLSKRSVLGSALGWGDRASNPSFLARASELALEFELVCGWAIAEKTQCLCQSLFSELF